MPYKDRETKLRKVREYKARTHYRYMRRLRLRQQGLCRECARPSLGKVRCVACSTKHQQGAGRTLLRFKALTAALHQALYPESRDRRHNQICGGALTWALHEHQERCAL